MGVLGVRLLPQLAPALLADFDPVLLGGALDPAPGRVALGVADPFDLIEAGDRVAHVAGVVERLLAWEKRTGLRRARYDAWCRARSLRSPLASETHDCRVRFMK